MLEWNIKQKEKLNILVSAKTLLVKINLKPRRALCHCVTLVFLKGV